MDDDEIIDNGYSPVTQVQIPPEMVVSIAQGMVEPDEIAQKHGFTGERWEKLKIWAPFIAAVEAAKTELAANGHTFRVKAKFMAEELAEKTFIRAMGPDATFAQQFQATQFFTRVGGLEPKEDKNVQAGEGFSVTINMNGNSTTVSGSPARQAGPQYVEDVTPSPTQPGYMIAPLIDPMLFAEMAENQYD
jgi:hypothetical protein